MKKIDFKNKFMLKIYISGYMQNPLIKCCKSCGVDGISAEHFVFAHSRIHVLLSLLFSAFITHGYLPDMFMKTAIVPIIKNKNGNNSDKTIIDQLLW